MTFLIGVQARLAQARLMVCLDLREDLAPLAQTLYSAGVDAIVIRDVEAPHSELLAGLEQVRALSYDYQGLVVVDDDADLAEEFGADVLHLGQSGGGAEVAHERLPAASLVGRSCHDERQLRAGLADAAVDYLLIGPVYRTSADPAYPPPGLDLVRLAARLAPPAEPGAKPWFAVGGITGDSLEEVLEAGARRVCVVGGILDSPDPGATAVAMKNRLRRAWADQAEATGRLGMTGRPRATFADTAEETRDGS